MELLYDLGVFAGVLAESTHFQEWVSASDEGDAESHIFLMSDRNNTAQYTEGYAFCVLSHGTGHVTELEAVDLLYLTRPQIKAEFVVFVDPEDTDSETFAQLLADISGVISDLLQQNTCVIEKCTFDGDDTPSRGPASSVGTDWVSVVLVFDLEQREAILT